MISAEMPELLCENDIDNLKKMLQLSLDDREADSFFKDEIKSSIADWYRHWDWYIHEAVRKNTKQ